MSYLEKVFREQLLDFPRSLEFNRSFNMNPFKKNHDMNWEAQCKLAWNDPEGKGPDLIRAMKY